MDDLLKEFLSETLESIEVIDFELVKFEKEPSNKEILDNIFRLLHTIKGTCGFLGLPKLQSVAHAAETLMDRYRDGMGVTSEGVTAILKSIDEIKTILDHLNKTDEEPATIDDELIECLNTLSGETDNKDKLALSFQDVVEMANAGIGLPEQDETENAERNESTQQEHVTETNQDNNEKEDDALENSMVEASSAQTAANANQTDEHVEKPAPIKQKVPAPTIAKQGSSAQKSTIADDHKTNDHGAENQSIRVNLGLLEHLMNTVSELVLTRNQLLEIFRHQSDSDFKVPLLRLSSVTTELQDTIVKTRMQPIGNAWKKLPRIVRDLAQSLDKKIELVMSGDQTELDRQVLERIKDPLTHMVRNSADHGIENPEEREAQGKTARGTIHLSAYHEGGQVIIQIEDNGRGLNADAIREKLIRNGDMAIDEIDKLTKQELYNQVFAPGFSTATEVTNVSGRGVGMDVVRTNIELIGGTVTLKSEPGKGTTSIIKIPLTLAIIPALIIGSNGDRFAVPQASVIELVRTKDGSDHVIDKIKDTQVLRLRDKLLPLVRLDDIFSKSDANQSSQIKTETQKTHPANEQDNVITPDQPTENSERNDYIIVMQVGQIVFGVIVDNVFHTEEIVVKPMTSLLKGLQVFSGNTILGDGQVILIIDPNGVAQHFRSQDVGRALDNNNQKPAINQTDQETLLLFRAGSDEPKVVPLSLVTRLEDIPVQNIEKTQNGYVVQYRETLMPLVMLSENQTLKTDGSQPMIVFTESGLSLGLVVDDLIDIVDEKLDIGLSSEKLGVLGSAVICGTATEVIDVGYYLTKTFEEWFVLKDQPELGYKPLVLLVDDSPFFRNLLKPIIQSAGFKVVVASSGEEALNVLELSEKVDILVSDLEMDPIDGYGLAAQIKATPEFASMPMIAISSQAKSEAFPKVQAAGFEDFVGKFDRPGLVTALKDMRGVYGDVA